MKSFAVLALVFTSLFEIAQCHYMFQYLIANGQQGAKYQNVRKNTNYNSPVQALDSTDLRCNVGASNNGGNTTTVAVAAGSSVGFSADVAVYHLGPVAFYMTKVESAAAADGSTDWFKIKEIGPTFSGGKAQWDMSQTYSATIPACLAPGDYLLRIEQTGLHVPGRPEFFISCAQLKVTGGGSVNPQPTSKIPGHISPSDPGYTANIYDGFTSYTVPGPQAVTC
ncbi:hypothetical protein BS50DRAFT_69586 [Corynespora cassiicola Philippines]|uniref:AA9 family lytic polysaccharide monooxygenase n=1 Tax=Corynespora cassiicola Philippines TaxID=1448308 RepID=A0A2T2NFS5_CORCC|nr:hypothetical protein BS50DRAFT_69586 [Corynespora cassiicola Philippines]